MSYSFTRINLQSGVTLHLSGVNLHLSGVKCHFSGVTLTLVKLK